MCKPKECCGEGHKHYVINTESMAGVCVRHNDDCNAVCVPAKPDDTKRKVCTKGCNRIMKVPNANATKDETDETKAFNIVVCQVDHRIVCDPWVDVSSNTSSSNTSSNTAAQKSSCHTQKWVHPVARCHGFRGDMWKAGATCIANLAHGDTHPQCGDKVKQETVDFIKKGGCVAVKTETEIKENADACYNLALPLAEYF